MPRTEVVSAYPWHSDAVYVAELDGDGVILRANAALAELAGTPPDGLPFHELLAGEQRSAFLERLTGLSTEWQQASFGFHDGSGRAAEDRCVWMRRGVAGHTELVAEPAWRERDRLVDQVLQLNDDLIATQRTLARRQRDLERAQDQATRSARRIRQLEAIVLAGLVPRDFDEALHSLLQTAQQILPGDRADILLLDEAGERLATRATAGPGAPAAPGQGLVAIGEGVFGTVAANGQSSRVDDLSAIAVSDGPALHGSMIRTPLRVEGEVIGVLAASAPSTGSFSEADLRLLEVVGERVALAVGQAQIRDREQRLVETLQRALLPQQLPTVAGLEIAARYRPLATSVGGDFYDAVVLGDGMVGIAIGDVTGKGLRAAAAMGRLRSALHAYALDSPSPAAVISRLDRFAAADGAIATALYLVLDPAVGRVTLASAGHLPPLLIDGDSARYLELGRALSPPLGLAVDTRDEIDIELRDGSAVVLYTDGLIERTRNVDEGLPALREAASRSIGESLDALCEHVLAALAPGNRYRDDVALLGVRWTSAAAGQARVIPFG